MNNSNKKTTVGILGATGMVGQRFVTLLADHPWFEVSIVAASERSAGRPYEEAVEGRWAMNSNLPDNIKKLNVYDVVKNMEFIAKNVDLVFCALDMEKADIKLIEENYAKNNVAVVSNNSAHRWTDDIPMLLPEVNYSHLELITNQKLNRGWDKGFIVVKPNCSIQSYVPALSALADFGPSQVIVTTLQSISGAGKTFETWPEIVDNVIPFIGGEEEKSEKEPLRVLGKYVDGKIELHNKLKISATCTRVATSDGHMATVHVKFEKKPSMEQILRAWGDFQPLHHLDLPSSPKKLLNYLFDENRPQTNTDRNCENGMGISLGRLREDNIFDWKFICLSHNTLRGAAGGALLTAELLKAKNYI
jgi:aspartate-semialdehyde dehydrogenase